MLSRRFVVNTVLPISVGALVEMYFLYRDDKATVPAFVSGFLASIATSKLISPMLLQEVA